MIFIHADDFGLSKGITDNILETYDCGSLSSTSIIPNGLAFDYAIKEYKKRKDLRLSIHLNLVEGKPLSKNPHLLTDNTGNLCNTFQELWLKYILGSQEKKEILKNQVKNELRAQIKKVKSKLPKYKINIDSHLHFHMIPFVFDTLMELHKEFKFNYVRIPYEPFSLPKERPLQNLKALNPIKVVLLNHLSKRNKNTLKSKKINFCDYFIGVLFTGNMSKSSIDSQLKRIKPSKNQTIEILLHPGAANQEEKEKLKSKISSYYYSKWRFYEKNVLKTLKIKNNPVKNQSKKLKLFLVIDESTYHPNFVADIIKQSEDQVVGAALVTKAPKKNDVEGYIKSHFYYLTPIEFIKLGLKTVSRKIKDKLPSNNFYSVKSVLDFFNINHIEVQKSINQKEYLDFIKKSSPDIIISSNPLIFKEEILNLPKICCLNRHSALLPSCGGVLPVLQAIKNNEKYTGTTIHTMVKQIDKGKIISQKKVKIKNKVLDTLYEECYGESVPAVLEAIDKVRNGKIVGIKNNYKPSYYSWPSKDDWNLFRKNGGRII